MNRRDFMKTTAGAYLLGSLSNRLHADFLPGGTLDLTTVPKYKTQLAIPAVMRTVSTSGGVDQYMVAARQFSQQILPAVMKKTTTVFGYGSLNDADSFHYPGPTFEARANRKVRVTWINNLVDNYGRYVPHILPVDPTLHWANPAGPPDSRPDFRGKKPTPYTGPVPHVTHLHGARVFDDSDGYPGAWYLPQATNIPHGYSKVGTHYDDCREDFLHRVGLKWQDGMSIYEYDNQQPSGTLWYHDHVLGITRLNVYAGLAGFYLLRGPDEDKIARELPSSDFEIPLCIQDRSFNSDGSLFFAASRTFFDTFTGPFIPNSDIPPFWGPEFFGNTMVVNGNTWPTLDIEPRRYRFRVLNGCNARTLILKITKSLPNGGTSNVPALKILQIGADGGFMTPAKVDGITLMPGQRNDIIIDFSGVALGTTLYMINEGPEEPYGGPSSLPDAVISDPGTTGQVIRIQVSKRLSSSDAAPPLVLAVPPSTTKVTRTRRLSLNEFDSGGGPMPPGPQVFWNPGSGNQCFNASNSCVPAGPRGSFLGTVDKHGNPIAYEFMDDVTENPGLGDTEIWEIYNFTADAHPIHVHLVQFELINRQNMAVDADGVSTAPLQLVGKTIAPESWELGPKDTVAVYPGMVTRIKMTFDRKGLYLWHCHILDHEDNDMMRPYRIGC